MKFRSLESLRLAALLAALLVVSACSDDRPDPLSEVEIIDIPAADPGSQANQNISNPTLEIPVTYPVEDGDELTLVWSEEFDGPEIDPEVWFFESGDGSQYGFGQVIGKPPGWGNNELQYYLPDNAMIVNGVLEITARRETVGDFNYTSSRINTRDRFAFQYGRIEASIKFPSGEGLWPAFWMLSQDSDYLCDGVPCEWAATGEIDIVEAVNLDGTGGNEVFSTIHYGGEETQFQQTSSGTTYTPGEDVTENFHTYALEWDENEFRWYFDGQLIAMENSWFTTADNEPYPAPFNQPFHILLNVAVGGDFPGSPNGATPFPATMEVDWVRVYSGEPPPPPPPPPPFDDGLLSNGDFEAGVDPWLAGVTDPIGAANVIDDGGNNVYFVDVTAAGNAFDVNLSQKLTITPDETYTLTFKARSNVARSILAGIGLSDGTFANTTQSVNLTTDWQTFTVELTAAGFGDANSRVLFDLGAEVGEVYIDDVSLVVSTGGGTPPFDPGLLSNGDFEAGVDSWLAGVTDPIGAANVIDDGGNNVYFVDVTAAGNSFDVNLSQKLTITPDETYTLTFKARSNVARSILAGIGLSDGTFANTTQSVNLTTDWQTFTVELTAAGFGDANSRVLFDLGAEVGEVYIDDVSLVVSTGGGAGGEIADNGGFESGDFTGWTQFEAVPGDQTVNMSMAGDTSSEGTFHLEINNTASGTNSLIKQERVGLGTVTPGASWTVSFDARGSFGAGGVAFAQVFSETAMGNEDCSGCGILGGAPLAVDADPTVWTSFSFSGTAGPSTESLTLQLEAVTGGSNLANVFYDNISIVVDQ